jgi:hypothetical protein
MPSGGYWKKMLECGPELESVPEDRRGSRFAFPRLALRRTLLALIVFAFAVQQARAGFLERVDIGRPDFAVFVLSGTITGGETIALQREISHLPSSMPVAVVLNSPGGNLREGLLLGLFFYSAKIPTFVMGNGGGCFSACSIAFLGGRDRVTGKLSRFKMASSSLGFHQFRTVRSEEMKTKIYKKADVDEEIKRTRSTTLILIKYLLDIHEDMEKLHLMLSAPAEKMNIITNEQAIALGIHVMEDNANEFIAATTIQERVQAP